MSSRIVTICTIAAILALTGLCGGRHAGISAARFHFLQTDEAQPGCPETPAGGFAEATCDLNSLIANSSSDAPLGNELFSWFNKCDIGLIEEPCKHTHDSNSLDDQDFCTKVAIGEGAALQPMAHRESPAVQAKWAPSKPLTRAALSSFELPRQIGKHAGTPNPLVTGITKQPFDSVLYNKQAACSIRKMVAKDPAHPERVTYRDVYAALQGATAAPDSAHGWSILPGSMVVKLIWQLLPDQSSNSNAFEFQVADTNDLRHLFHTIPYPGSVLPNAAQTSGSRYTASIDWATNGPDCSAPPASTPQLYPASCFNLLDLKLLDPKQFSKFLSQVVSTHTNPEGTARYMALVGINTVKFRATPNTPPDSLWSAFWWAQAKPDPLLFQQSGWEHFVGCSVDKARTGPIREDRLNLCYNPYLEGHQSPNGAYSNCLNCHQQASYQKSQQLVADDIFTTHNKFVTCLSSLDSSGSPPSVGSPPSDCTPDPFANSPTVNTNLLWSLADFIGPPPASASNAPHVNTRKNAQK